MAHDDVRAELEPLVATGQLTARQADAVAGHLVAGRLPRRGAPAAAEAVGYLGAALSAAALLRVADRFWVLLDVWAQVSVLLIVAGALWAGGAWARRGPAAAGADRLAGVLWLLSAAAGTGAAAVVAHAADAAGLVDLTPARSTLTVGLAALGIAVPMWAARRKALQLLVVYAATLTVACGALWAADVDVAWAWGVLVTAIGAAWTALAWGGALAPPRAALVLGALAAVSGPHLVGLDAEWLGLALATATAGGVLAASVPTGQAALAGIGTVSVTVALVRAISSLLPSELGWTIGLLVAGVTLLAGALVTLRVARAAPARTPGR